MRTKLARSSLFLLVCALLSTGLYAVFADTARSQATDAPTVGETVTPQTSPALRDLPTVPAGSTAAAAPVAINPHLTTGQELAPSSPTQLDPALQPPPVSAAAVSPPPVVSFGGASATELNATYLPPDVSGDVGPNHYVQMINSVISIYDKQGTRLAGPTPINNLWRGQDNPCGRLNDGDPIVLYDQMADRWLVSQFAINEAPIYYECIAISQTPDPTGTFYLYAFNVGKEFPDYPKFGIWPDALHEHQLQPLRCLRLRPPEDAARPTGYVPEVWCGRERYATCRPRWPHTAPGRLTRLFLHDEQPESI